ncbi:hypothetical protein HGP16_26160 [Rhizobium sp. P40RR-XXII]|uniref:DUF6481 family protein n=1 Tax=unclassified Rhizobium TaxID=2613769 RepID=UPI0014572085|nr:MULTISPECIES: DUF6481 family protein [unclassified Rhizobium]NLR85369.1 hypothetical protein [Rhizobium sp. P28RR-XV]NLS20025.1 hypothetical protein [Rhizobium sp. P40RR-XXII]
MRHLNDNSFAERRKTAENAKRELLTKFASAPKLTDPATQQRIAARAAVAAARMARQAEREALKAAENERLLQEAAASAAAAEAHEKAEAHAGEVERNNRLLQDMADEAERKAERDRRYAARKARQG